MLTGSDRPIIAKLPRSLTSSGAIALAVCLLVILAYVPLSFFRFAFADDYTYLMLHAFRSRNPFFAGDGRPFGGLLAVALFTTFDTISSAAILRLIGLSELIVVLILVQRAAVIAGLDAMWAAFVAVAFAAAPSIQHWVVWGVSSWQFAALILGVAAFYPWRTLTDVNGKLSVGSLVCFFGFPLLAMFTYQPFATAAWPLIALDILMKGEDRVPYRKIIIAVAAFCAMLLLSFLVSKVLLATLVPIDRKVRIAVVGLREIPERLEWFFREPLMTALTPLRIQGDPLVASTVAGIILIGLVIGARSVTGVGLALLITLSTLVLANLPSLIPAENTPIRSHVVVALQVFVMLGLALQRIAGRMKLAGPALVAAIVSCCFALAIWASSTVIRYNAFPQALELALIERALAAAKLPDTGPIVLIAPPPGSSIAGGYCDNSDTMGCVSSTRAYYLANLVKLWMREHGIDPARYKVLLVYSKDDAQADWFQAARTTSVPVPDDAYFLDLASIVLGRAPP